MHIVFLLFIDLNFNGPSSHLLKDIINACALSGDKISVVMPLINRNSNNSWPDGLIQNKNIAVYRVQKEEPKKSKLLSRFFRTIKYSNRCCKSLRRLTPYDVVFVQSNTALYTIAKKIKKISNVPILYNAQDLFPQDLLYVKGWKKSNPLYQYLLKKQKRAFDFVDKIITISKDMQLSLFEMGVDSSKIELVYNWSYSNEKITIPKDSNLFIKNNNLRTSKFSVLYAGNVGKKQNLSIITESAKKLSSSKDISFVVVGDRRDSNQYGYIVSDNISYYPLQSKEMAESVYASCDVIVITLKRGIIKTALPSKTATCLRFPDKHIIFCIEKESEFAKSLNGFDNIHFCEPDNSDELSSIVRQLSKNNNPISNPAFMFFLNNMSCVDNPKKYYKSLEALAKTRKNV